MFHFNLIKLNTIYILPVTICVLWPKDLHNSTYWIVTLIMFTFWQILAMQIVLLYLITLSHSISAHVKQYACQSPTHGNTCSRNCKSYTNCISLWFSPHWEIKNSSATLYSLNTKAYKTIKSLTNAEIQNYKVKHVLDKICFFF